LTVATRSWARGEASLERDTASGAYASTAGFTPLTTILTLSGNAKSALQITPILLYFVALKLTFSAQLGSLFGTIALVSGNPREQVSEGFLIKTLTAIGG